MQKYTGSVKAVRRVLSILAGSKALKDPDVLDRFIILQQAVADEVVNRTGEAEVQVAANFILGLFQEEPEWKEGSLCNDHPEVNFFPARGESTRVARAICNQCPVEDECLFYIMQRGDKFGIWGGLSERNRRIVRRATKRGMEPSEISEMIRDFRVVKDKKGDDTDAKDEIEDEDDDENENEESLELATA